MNDSGPPKVLFPPRVDPAVLNEVLGRGGVRELRRFLPAEARGRLHEVDVGGVAFGRGQGDEVETGLQRGWRFDAIRRDVDRDLWVAEVAQDRIAKGGLDRLVLAGNRGCRDSNGPDQREHDRDEGQPGNALSKASRPGAADGRLDQWVLGMHMAFSWLLAPNGTLVEMAVEGVRRRSTASSAPGAPPTIPSLGPTGSEE